MVEFRTIEPHQTQRLNDILGSEHDTLEQLTSSYRFPLGFFRSGPGQSRRFYKILPPDFCEIEMFSASIEDFLSAAGITTRSIQIRTVELEGERFCVCSMPYLQLQPFQASPAQCGRLGELLKRIHLLLDRHPRQEQSRNNWLVRLTRMRDALIALQKSRRSPEGVTVEMLRLLEKRIDLLSFDLRQAQMVHGDLNPGNVLHLYNSGGEMEPALIDFENSRFAWFPRHFDIAMLIQRLLMEGTNPGENVKALLRGYGKLEGSEEIPQAMIAMSTRSQLILIEKFMHGGRWHEKEWKKFTGLIDQASRHRDRIARWIE